ncbi:AP-4 complex subunit sigma-1-like [Xenia sp. Carnegie-2017]|uniref:AP-4 complex subunit sigma-1-like n=1 Tax=Xenia sp. Carnegie-2017 TaxID=2897299 RepID=UPI001F0393F6|nr:AP-4 complex subunit sigma-1-like [Xenia sp. Carnegie-2017]
MFKYFLILTKDGRTRFARYYIDIKREEKVLIEAEIGRKCLQRGVDQCTFMEYKDHKIVYRRYASLYFVAGVDEDENDLSIYEFIQNIVEVLNSYFKNVTEMHILGNLDRVYMILDEMIMNGDIVEPRKKYVLATMKLIDEKSR